MFDEPTEEELKEIQERIKKQSGLTDEEWEAEQKKSAEIMQKATEDKCKELLEEGGIENPTKEQIEEYMGYAREHIGNSSHVEVISMPNQE